MLHPSILKLTPTFLKISQFRSIMFYKPMSKKHIIYSNIKYLFLTFFFHIMFNSFYPNLYLISLPYCYLCLISITYLYSPSKCSWSPYAIFYSYVSIFILCFLSIYFIYFILPPIMLSLLLFLSFSLHLMMIMIIISMPYSPILIPCKMIMVELLPYHKMILSFLNIFYNIVIPIHMILFMNHITLNLL